MNIPDPQVGIAIDAWKLPIFERYLTAGGFTYTQGPGLTADSLHLYVRTSEIQTLAEYVRKANAAAAKERPKHVN